MKEQIKEYKKQLEQGIEYYMMSPVSERVAEAVENMSKCWLSLDKMYRKMDYNCELTEEDAEKWNAKMKNEDGTDGGLWTTEQTTAVAESLGVEFEHITDYDWNVTMNMMYSDYWCVAEMFGISTPKFYGEMAKAFLFDVDAKSPKEKLSAYYDSIVK